MNVFMGYNPLVTKQAKVTVWVCEQDGATPVAPSNPNEGDCFVVYATDEAVLSNAPTSKKTYSNGEWADAESGGGGGGLSVATVTIACTSGTIRSTIPTLDEEYGQTTASALYLTQGVQKTYKVPLYTNGAFVGIGVKDGTTPLIQGDAVYEDGGFSITGDCVISVETD